MKQILFAVFAAAAVLLSSCSKDDNPTKSNPLKISIGGAKYIYANPNATRASSGELAQFMAVNDKGESKPIRFLNSDNDTIDMKIFAIQNLGDEYVILGGNFRYADKGGTVNFHNMLANKKTELVYAMNTNFQIYTGTPLIYIDQNNNLYQQTDNHMIYQYNVSDPNNIRLSEYVPNDEISSSDPFFVNKRGFCFYRIGNYSGSKVFKIKCPGGRIYTSLELFPEETESFSIFKGYKNDTFLIVAHRQNPGANWKSICYELVENGLNELVVTKRSEIDHSSWYRDGVFSNPIQKTHLMEDYGDVLEYNEETQKLTKLNIRLPSLSQYVNFMATTKNNLFIYDKDKNELVILKLADNNITKINLVGKYELRSMEGDINSDEVSFSGLRFADGRNIVGTIDENGQFHAIETINATTETVLIRLN